MGELYRWGVVDLTTLQAAVCHDVLEDTACSMEELTVAVGKDVANIVRELTFDGKDKKAYMESFKYKSIEAYVIKLADRLRNVMDFQTTEPDYAKKYYEKANVLWYDAHRTDEMLQKFGPQVCDNYREINFEVEVRLGITTP
jgi:(p)ppGpp synthase/HD superfamily hydrolase